MSTRIQESLARYAIDGAIANGELRINPPPEGHWLRRYWDMAAANEPILAMVEGFDPGTWPPRGVKLDANERPLPEDSKDHVATEFMVNGTRIQIAREFFSVDKPAPARKRAKEFRLFGADTWSCGTVMEQLLGIDRSRIEPAVNLSHWPEAPKYGFIWTDEDYNPSSPSGFAFGVLLSSGSVSWDGQYYGGVCRPVRRVSARQ